MKRILFIMLVLLTNTTLFAQTQNLNKKTKLLVYYFHITDRCNTCRSIEAVTIKVLNENFKNELDSEIIVFKTFNVEYPENKYICEKYQAYGATLALTKVEFGAEVQIEDMSNFAFSKIHTEELFTKGLKDKINEFIK